MYNCKLHFKTNLKRSVFLPCTHTAMGLVVLASLTELLQCFLPSRANHVDTVPII